MEAPKMRTRTRRLALGAILLFALVLRLWNLDWDQGTHQHPDERHWSFVSQEISAPDSIGEYFDAEASPLNPYQTQNSFVYGTAPLFMTKMTGSFLLDGPQPAGAIVNTLDAVGVDLLRDDGTPKFDAGYNLNLVGRLLSALVDTATVLLVYLLGRELFSRRVGLVAALLQASTVLHIQYAHFFGSEPWAAFFVTAVMLGSLRIAKGDARVRTAIWTGAALGLAVASKLNTAVVVVVPFLATLVAGLPLLKPGAVKLKQATYTALSGLMVLIMGLIFFRVWQPYTFSGLISREERFKLDFDYITTVNTGEGGYPWIFQWIGKTPLIYPLESAFWWGMGPALAIAVVVGVALAVRAVVAQQRYELLLPLAFLAAMLGLVAQQFNPLIRYLLPAYPTATVLGAWAVVHLWDIRHRFAKAAKIAAASLVGITVLWALAFTNGAYGNTHPRIQATEWISENIPSGSVVSSQAWDDALPLYLVDVANPQLETVQLDPFFPDRGINGESGLIKPDDHIAKLDRIDYIIEASNKLYGAVPQFPAKYPSTVAYYQALFDGRLGFEQVAEFSSPPSLFGIQIDTASAEETFTVYDQPMVTIWRKTDAYSSERARALLNPDQARAAADVPPIEATTNALLLTPDERSTIASGGTFGDIFSVDGPTSKVSWLWWLLFLQLTAFAVLPWTTQLFKHLPDRGYGLSKVIGMLAVALPVWLTVSWNAANFGAAVIWFWVAVVVGVGIWGWMRSADQVATALSGRRGAIIAAELVFLLAYAFVLYLRSVNPDLWEPYLGGEKPMEMAYLTAIARTTELPAYDPWLAGGSMNYYYMGWFLVAVPMRALKILPEVGFNLGLATFAAITAATAFSVSYNMVALSRTRLVQRLRNTDTTVWADSTDADTPLLQSPGRSPIYGGLFGVALLMVLGNWAGFRQHLDRLRMGDQWSAPPEAREDGSALSGLFSWLGGEDLKSFDWWGPSRVNSSNGNIDITEFPYFSFLFGDLHPHVMGLVFVGLTLALALGVVASLREGDTTRGWLLVAGLGVSTGLSRATNTWDLPTVLLISVLAIGLGHILSPKDELANPQRQFAIATLVAALGLTVLASGYSPGGGVFIPVAGGVGLLALLAMLPWPDMRARLLLAGRDLGTLAVVHVVVFWPYLANTETFSVGTQPAEFFTPFDGFITHYGTFLVIGAAFAAAVVVNQIRRNPDRTATIGAFVLASALAGLLGGRIITRGASVLFDATVSVLGAASSVAVGASVLMLGLFLIEVTSRERDTGLLFSLGLFSIGMAIIAGVDVITVENDIQRMNTVFKFWLQSWQVLALASAYGIWFVGSVLGGRDKRPAESTLPATARAPRAVRLSWGAVVAILVVVGATYPLLATGERLDRRFAYGQDANSLNGLDYLYNNPTMPRRDQGEGGPESLVALADDLPLIEYLRYEVEGTPTIVEWSGGTEHAGSIYEWTSRIAITTGLPTVLGWDWHQQQQRWGFQDMIFQRRTDVQNLYLLSATAEDISRFVRTYKVDYIVVGVQEHRFGNEAALAQIALHPATIEVARNGPNALYRIDHSQIWPGLPPEDAAELLALGN